MKKIILYISDGVGCRNFIYSSFIENAATHGYEVVILKNVSFTFDAKGCRIIEYPKLNLLPIVDILKNIKIEAELNLFTKKFNNQIYQKYIKKNASKKIKDIIKSIYKNYKIKKTTTVLKISEIEDTMYEYTKKSPVYEAIGKILTNEKPNVIMFANQRSITNIPIILAAEKLKIPSITNIFSWDNLPKATKIHKSDYYFVWSQYMHDELLSYYPNINSNTIKITGTPQFSSYSNQLNITERNAFFEQYKLNPSYLYITFSGDDYTTSPHDDIFLDNLCKEVKIFNINNGNKLKILFRSSPVDQSNRFDEVLKKNEDIVTAIKPLWKSEYKGGWQSVYPLKEDNLLLKNILYHSSLVVNFGSTIALDASFFNTPACYVKYQPIESNWIALDSYKYVHFDTLKGLNPVFWINNVNDYQDILTKIMKEDTKEILHDAHLWAERIILHPIDKVHDRMWNEIKLIANK